VARRLQHGEAMSSKSLAASVLAALVAMVASTSSASAQDERTLPSSAAVPPDGERTQSPREASDDKRHPVAVTLNPLGFAIQRYGMNVEVVPIPHHALVGNLHLQSVPAWIARTVSGYDQIKDDSGSSVGGEIGYRLYSGRRGANGVFVGGSFVSTPLAYPRLMNDLATVELSRFQANGAALDIGAQAIIEPGFTIGAGLGVMYLAYAVPDDLRRVPIGVEPHVFPRLLMTAGWSF